MCPPFRINSLSCAEIGAGTATATVGCHVPCTARSPLASRLEALLALRRWPSDPAATTAYLQGSLGLTFDHPAPVGASRAVKTNRAA